MKTIIEAAVENRNLEIKSGEPNDSMFNSRLGMQILLDKTFANGVEFAQRWIPVSEELPEKNIDVIAKSNNTFWIARLQPHGKGLTLYSIKGSRYSEEFEATHWRPISFL